MPLQPIRPARRTDRHGVRDLLGPAGGPEEELDQYEDYVFSRYLVGMLAPTGSEIAGGELDELAATDGDEGEEGAPEPGVSAGNTYFPSLMGLSFVVGAETSAIVVEAQWGHYLRIKSATQLKRGASDQAVPGEPPLAADLGGAGRGHFPAGTRGGVAGLLLYTAAPDSEGTLGGLVELGDPLTLGRHLQQALECMRLCASDPLCADQRPDTLGRGIQGACCHACQFAPETSCERSNRYLDRSAASSLLSPVAALMDQAHEFGLPVGPGLAED